MIHKDSLQFNFNVSVVGLRELINRNAVEWHFTIHNKDTDEMRHYSFIDERFLSCEIGVAIGRFMEQCHMKKEVDWERVQCEN